MIESLFGFLKSQIIGQVLDDNVFHYQFFKYEGCLLIMYCLYHALGPHKFGILHRGCTFTEFTQRWSAEGKPEIPLCGMILRPSQVKHSHKHKRLTKFIIRKDGVKIHVG